jgi:hypothetical protein
MIIEEHALRNWIENFYGYGSWQARFWFISHEESGGELPEEVADKLNYFQQAELQERGTLCSIRDMYRSLPVRWDGPKANSYNNFYEYRFGEQAIQHGVWKNLISFMYGYRDQLLSDIREYQQHQFLSSSTRNEALIVLYPLPSPHNHAWYYSWLDMPKLDFIKKRVLYQDHVYQNRIETILSNVGKFHPELVLMYGMENINTIKKSVQEHFQNVKFSMIKATKLQIPQHHRADFNGTTMLITTQIPALRHNRIETGFDWYDFGKKAKAETPGATNT